MLLFEEVRVYFTRKKEIKMNVQRQVLRRSKSNRWIAGVCGGLGEFFGINPFWFRLAMFIALIPGGVPGILIYLIAMTMIPSE
jgi:phage shock protein C